MTSTSGDGPAAGWYPDPDDGAQQRYWDGGAWTEHRHPGTPTLDDTAVLPPLQQPATPSDTPAATAGTRGTGGTSRGGRGWVAALVGLIAGLVVGGTAALVVAGNNDNSSTPSGSSSSVSTPTATTTATATVTESVTTTATATSTVTATVTVTASPSP